MPDDVMELAAAERRDFADLLETLDPAQWEAASLCARWRVRDVVAHVLSYDVLSPAGLAGLLLRGRLTVDGANRVGVARLADRSTGELLTLLREHERPSGLTAALGGRIGLTDGLIHHQDVRRPLGLAREVPADRLRVALTTSLTAPTLPSRRRLRGLRLVATDLGWSGGSGPVLTAPGELLLMLIAGRQVGPDELDALDGPGLAVLRDRAAR